MSMLCQVFRSPRREGLYLYVDRSRGLADVPESLLGQFGTPAPVMVLRLSHDRKLARADANEVLASIRERGYYLQLPPGSAVVLPGEMPGG